MSIKVKGIVAMDAVGLVGRDNHLPWRNKEDLMYFKETTMGNVLIMGGSTYRGIGKKLEGRTVIVVSKTMDKALPGDWIVGSPEEALGLAKKIATNTGCDIFIAGGPWIWGSVLKDAITEWYVTTIKGSYQGNVYFDWSLLQGFNRTIYLAVKDTVIFTILGKGTSDERHQ